MKPFRFVPAFLIALTVFLLCACASAENLTVETEPGLFRVRFSLPGESFAVVRYSTQAETGWFTLYSEDGQFSGESPLLCSYDPCRLAVTAEQIDGKGAEQVKTDYPGTPLPEGTALAFENPGGKVRDLELFPADGGIAYRFTAPGQGSVKLEFRAVRQTGSVILYPDEHYEYSGTLMLPHVYNASNVYVTLRSGKGDSVIAEGQTTKGYTLLPGETGSAEDGRLKGVVVCVDPGHQNAKGGEREPLGPGLSGYGSAAGGMAEGTVTRRRESIVMLECGYVIRDELLRQGATVVMTREIEEKRVSNLERDAVANDAGAHVMIRLHGDLNQNTGFRGFSLYYPVRSEYAQAVANSETYRSYGQMMLDALAARCSCGKGVRTRLEGTDRFVGNNWAMMPCFLIELGFMSNRTDDILLSTPEYQQWLAEGLADGIYELMIIRGMIIPEE